MIGVTKKSPLRVAVIGAGAWGTALSVAIASAGHHVHLLTRNKAVYQAIHQHRVNDVYLPNITLPSSISVHTMESLPIASTCDVLLCVVPSQALRLVASELSAINFTAETPLIICSKGIECKSLMLMHEVVHEVLPNQQIGILSGPNFADEIARHLPTGATLACEVLDDAMCLAKHLSSQSFRIYGSQDIVGCQIAGALKNVLAIACGITQGRSLGSNALAALITRGVNEITRLCVAKGGDERTLMGLSGIGDIVLTCTNLKSRNMSLGFELGEGMPLHTILSKRHTTTEGISSAEAVIQLSKKLHVQMPICEAVYRVLYEEASIEAIVEALMSRPLVSE